MSVEIIGVFIPIVGLLVGGAIGIIVGGIIENSGVFSSPEVGYFSSIFLFGGAAQILAILYMNKKLQHKN